MKHILTLIRKDFLLEIRQQYSLYGVLLYVVSTIFVLKMAIDQPEEKVWNGLYWMIQIFICVNAVAKSFLQESNGRMYYFYTIAGPRHFIIAKLIFNILLMMAMSSVSLLLFFVLFGLPIESPFIFWGIALIGGASLSLVFTFLAAIAARAQQNAALMAIMGFPLIIPQLQLLMRISNIAFSDIIQSGLNTLIALLLGFNLLILALAVILFPFLWKD